MNLSIESEREDDGRWLAEVPQLPGVLAYGASRDEALSRAQVLALRVLAERLMSRLTRTPKCLRQQGLTRRGE
ncbi:MAG: type II toxin-antitoxin system HicB family antitoxin [Steroidobacteraceae bacterium]